MKSFRFDDNRELTIKGTSDIVVPLSDKDLMLIVRARKLHSFMNEQDIIYEIAKFLSDTSEYSDAEWGAALSPVLCAMKKASTQGHDPSQIKAEIIITNDTGRG